MIALLQRVSSASVVINTTKVAEANAGALVFLAIQKCDTKKPQRRCSSES